MSSYGYEVWRLNEHGSLLELVGQCHALPSAQRVVEQILHDDYYKIWHTTSQQVIEQKLPQSVTSLV